MEHVRIEKMKVTPQLIEEYFDKLWPICRSITGNGLRESFRILQQIIPLQLEEVPTGSKVLDWEIPKEWNIEDAYIITPDGKKICEFNINNLHVLNYSIPVDKEVEFEELEKHLYYIESLPDAIPYMTSYYKENWGFCISHNQFKSLDKNGRYRVVIKSTLAQGSLTYGHVVLKGESDREILLSTYLCHPSMANNELSGPLVMAGLYQKIAALKKRKYTYRFVLAPETIGVIAYLHKYGMYMKEQIDVGYVLTCCGDAGDFIYKMSKKEDSLTDRVAKHVLKHQEIPFKIIPFSVGGSDERQYCSPGFNFPVGSLTRSIYHVYKEYHTSLDNKSFISFDAMIKTIETYFCFVKALELNANYYNTIQFCEPQLGKRGLYPSSNSPDVNRKKIHDLMHLLSFSDGKHDLIEIAEKRNTSLFDFEEHIQHCVEKEILKIQ